MSDEPQKQTPAKLFLLKLRKYLLAGLLVWVPVLVTLWIIRFFVVLLDGSLKLLPAAYRPENALGFNVPGLGVILCLVILFFTGMLAANFFGQLFLKGWDRLIKRIPLVRTIYMAVKQIMETLFSSSGQAFRKVMLVEYPRKGLWSIAFQTATACPEVSESAGQAMIAVFVPTTPNPTSGFLIFVPKEDVRELNLSVDAALKMVISLGVMQSGMTEEQSEKLRNHS